MSKLFLQCSNNSVADTGPAETQEAAHKPVAKQANANTTFYGSGKMKKSASFREETC